MYTSTHFATTNEITNSYLLFLTNKNVKHKIEDDFFKSEAAACLLSLATNTKISKSSHRPAAVGVTVIVIVSGNIFFVFIEVV